MNILTPDTSPLFAIETIVERTKKIIRIKNDGSLPLVAATLLEDSGKKIGELVAIKDVSVHLDKDNPNILRKSTKLTFTKKDYAVTETMEFKHVYSRPAVREFYTFKLWCPVTPETIEEVTNELSSDATTISDAEAIIKVLDNRDDNRDLLKIVLSEGVKHPDPERLYTVHSYGNEFNNVTEVYKNDNTFVNYDVKAVHAFNAVLLKALENSYFITVTLVVDVNGILAR